VSDDADADIVKVIVRKGCDVSLLFRERVTFIATALGIEELPAAPCGIVDGLLFARDKVVERRIERNLRPFVGSDGVYQIGAIGPATEDLLKGQLVFLDRGVPGHRSKQVGLTHFRSD
jgi:hypothetical protein